MFNVTNVKLGKTHKIISVPLSNKVTLCHVKIEIVKVQLDQFDKMYVQKTDKSEL